jgi:hypothetical protein
MTTKKSKSTNKIKFIILNFGYVEDSHAYSWIYEDRIGFETKFEAALSLAVDYYHAYLGRYKQTVKLKQCCIENKLTKDNFCKTCGYNLTSDDEFNSEEYKEWLIVNSEKNMDGNEIVNYFDGCSNWCSLDPPYGITKENSLYIGNADKILIGLLYKTGLDNNIDENIAYEILSNTTFEKFKASFDKEAGPDIYG